MEGNKLEDYSNKLKLTGIVYKVLEDTSLCGTKHYGIEIEDVNNSIKHLKIPEGVEFIRDDTEKKAYKEFNDTENYDKYLRKLHCLERAKVEYLILPSSLKAIDCETFSYFKHLKKVEFSDYTEILGRLCFNGVPLRETLKIPRKLKTLGYGAFGKTQISEIDFNKANIENLGNFTFNNNINLKTVRNMGNKMLKLSRKMFEGCEALESVAFGQGLEVIEDGAFFKCYSLNNIDLSRTNIRRLGDEAFSNCTNLKNIKFSSTLWSVGDYCFSGCLNLKTLDLSRTSLEGFNLKSIEECFNLKRIKLPKALAKYGIADKIKRIYKGIEVLYV